MNKCYLCDLVINVENIGEFCNYCDSHICEFCYEKNKHDLYLRYGYICDICLIKY
jgi:hypothetical protein